MKRIVVKVILMTGILSALIFTILYENRKELWSETPQLFFEVGDEKICPWYSEADDIYYLFLPSYAEIDKIEISAYSEKLIYEDISGKNGYVSIKHRHHLNKEMTNRLLNCKREKFGDNYKLYIMQSAKLPSVFIDTKSGSTEHIKESKDNFESGKIRVYDESGNVLYVDSVKKIKGRGNTSFNGYEKKPWNLTFEKATNLFDMGFDTKYTLIANASDPTLVRNDYMRRMEQALEIPYVNIGQFVDLYINEQYQGNYYLCSPVEIGENRINICDLEKQSFSYITDIMVAEAEKYENVADRISDEEPENYDGINSELYNKIIRKGFVLPSVDEAIEEGLIDGTGGFLLERDYEYRYLAEYDDNSSSFVTKNGECFRVKSPEFCSVKQIEYIASFVEEAESAIMSENGIHPKTGLSYMEYIDIDSFAKRYLAEEISKNYDGGVSSTYFYKDSDVNDKKLHMAPGWDYDMSLGNYVEWMADISESPEGLTKLSAHSYPCLWFERLYDNAEYYELVVSYFHQYALPFLLDKTPLLVEQYRKNMGASIQMNHVRWASELGQNFQYKDIDTSYSDFQKFVQKRAEFLKEEWKQ